MIKQLIAAVFGTRYEREVKRLQPLVDADPRGRGAAQGPDRRRAPGPDRAVPRRHRGADRTRSSGTGRGARGQARLRRSGASARRWRTGSTSSRRSYQEGAGRGAGRAPARGLRHGARGVPPAGRHHGHGHRARADLGHGALRRPADRRHRAAPGQDRRDGDRRRQDARRHPAALPERARPAAARTSSRSTTTWPGATRSGWATSSAGSASRSPASTTPSRRSPERRAAYLSDITYGTNNEFGFDYLRDNMVFALEQRVQREHAYAIIDEVDSILIDEARTPLIISGPGGQRGRRHVRPVQPAGGRAGAEADRRGEHAAGRGREAARGREDAGTRPASSSTRPSSACRRTSAAQAAERDGRQAAGAAGRARRHRRPEAADRGSSRCGTSRTCSTSCSTRRATRCT